MASIEELSYRDKKRVARLVKQLLDVGKAHDVASAQWAAEKQRGVKEREELAASGLASRADAARLRAELEIVQKEAANAKNQFSLNAELLEENVDLRAKLVASLHLVRHYQSVLAKEQETAEAPGPPREPVENFDAVEDDGDGGGAATTPQRERGHEEEAILPRPRRLALATRCLEVAYGRDEARRCGEELQGRKVLTAADVDRAYRVSADVSYGEVLAPDGLDELLVAMDVEACVERRRRPEGGELLELGAGVGKLALSAFILEPRLRVVRGVELCASRFAAAEKAFLRLLEASKLEHRSSKVAFAGDQQLPQFELLGRSQGNMLRLGAGRRVIELRRGDLLDVPRAAVRDADVVLLLCKVPSARSSKLARLLEHLARHARLASLEPLDHLAVKITLGAGPRPRVATSWAPQRKHPLYVYERLLASPTKQPAPSQPRNLVLGWRDDDDDHRFSKPSSLRLEAGSRVHVGPRIPRLDPAPPRLARVLGMVSDGSFSVIYDADGDVEERVHPSRLSQEEAEPPTRKKKNGAPPPPPPPSRVPAASSAYSGKHLKRTSGSTAARGYY